MKIEEFTSKAKLLSDIVSLVEKDPDSYIDVISAANSGFIKFREGYTRKLTALDFSLWKLIRPKKAKEWLENRETQGYLNLDMFPELEDTLKRIAKYPLT